MRHKRFSAVTSSNPSNRNLDFEHSLEFFEGLHRLVLRTAFQKDSGSIVSPAGQGLVFRCW